MVSRAIRSVDSTIASRLDRISAAEPSPSNAPSAVARIPASGVRISCEASATNRRCRRWASWIGRSVLVASSHATTPTSPTTAISATTRAMPIRWIVAAYAICAAARFGTSGIDVQGRLQDRRERDVEDGAEDAEDDHEDRDVEQGQPISRAVEHQGGGGGSARRR